MKKKLLYIAIFLFLINISIINVYAAPSAGIGGGSYVPTPGSSSGINTSGQQSRPIAYGYRVSIVENDGKLVSGTHSIDYWSDWGNAQGYTSNRKVGYTSINGGEASYATYGDATNWLYYETPKPKTVIRTETTKKTNTLNNNYLKYVKKSSYIDSKYDNNSFTMDCPGRGTLNFYKPGLTSGGCAVGGDTRIGNNYTRLTLETFKKDIDNENLQFLYTILKDCGISGDDDNARALNSKDKYLLVEPLTAIYTNGGVTNGFVALGTPSDLLNMGVLNNYNNWVYTWMMYINPVVYNTYSAGPISSCSTPTTDRNKISGTGCVGVFTMYIGDIVKDTCDENARKIVNEYFNNGVLKNNKEQEYLEKLYKDDQTKKCVNYSNGKYTLKDDCNALDPLSIESFKGIKVKDACSNVLCEDQVETGLKNNYSSASDLKRIAEKLYDYWNSRGKNYMLLKENAYSILRPDGKPYCGKAEKDCEPNKGTIGNCSANMKFTDSGSDNCWESGVAYNDTDNKSDYNSYQSSVDVSLSSGSCKVYCYETVDFKLPDSSQTYNTKAGKIFKWGINNDIKNPLFGTMNVTRTCKAIDINTNQSCGTKDMKVAYWVTDRIDTIVNIVYNEPVSNTNKTAELHSKFINYTYNENTYTDSEKSQTINNQFKVSANYEFNYNKDLHWYADKSDSSKQKSESEIEGTSFNYVELGYGLPTQFTSPTTSYTIWNDGKYDWEKITKSSEGYMYATIKQIGTKNNDGTYHFDRLIKANTDLEGYFEDGTVKYGCDYSVINELFGYECLGTDRDGYCSPDKSPEGLDVVFRTIDLINTNNSISDEIKEAFPGQTGNGRNMGRNWSLDEKELVELLDSNVYEKNEPLYSIKLNSSTIQKIRNLNRKARGKNIDPYIGINTEIDSTEDNGYSGYKGAKDEKNKYSYYASEFLTYLKTESSIDYSGSCTDEVDTQKRAMKYKTDTCK